MQQPQTVTLFPVSEIEALRTQAEGACPRQRAAPPLGWSKSTINPMKFLKVFESLRLKSGFVLRVYQFAEGLGGNCIVWAMPADAPFLEPSELPRLTDRFAKPPKPREALPDFMEAIEGDGTPWSYMSASTFAREAAELGASWHGCDWSTHTILGAAPWVDQSHDELGGDADNWSWTEPQPSQWLPCFERVGDEITITFLTFSGLNGDAIYRHTDSFRSGSYKFKTDKTVIANGRGGYNF